ncbi:MAG: P-loop NTPase [bacterium]
MGSFFVRVEEKEFGPFTVDELKVLVSQGNFSREDLIWHEESDQWITAEGIDELQTVFAPDNGNLSNYQNKLLAVASGKGGVGKTVLSASMGVALASMGSEIILVDGDLGGPDMHTCLGMLEPKYTFFDFYSLQKDTLDEIALETPVENLRLISGACGTLGLANPKYFQKRRFMRELKRLQADYIILDLGAGSSYNVVDFFLLADEKFLVVSPEPTSVYEAFGFIKVCLMRHLNRTLRKHDLALEIIAQERVNRPGKIQLTINDLLEKIDKIDGAAARLFSEVLDSFRLNLILNMVKGREDIKEGIAIQAAAMELLSVKIQFLGFISYDPNVRDAVKRLKPFLLYNPKSQASQDLTALLRVNMLGKKGFKEILERRKWRAQIKESAKEFPDTNVLKDAQICSENCFYWGDCEYEAGGNPCRVRHLEPVLRE